MKRPQPCKRLQHTGLRAASTDSVVVVVVVRMSRLPRRSQGHNMGEFLCTPTSLVGATFSLVFSSFLPVLPRALAYLLSSLCPPFRSLYALGPPFFVSLVPGAAFLVAAPDVLGRRASDNGFALLGCLRDSRFERPFSLVPLLPLPLSISVLGDPPCAPPFPLVDAFSTFHLSLP